MALLIPLKYQNLEGLYVTFTEPELKLAIAIAEAIAANGGIGGGGGGGSDASASNQVAGNTLLASIDNKASNLEDLALETTLNSINTKIPGLGQALAAASTPVVLTAVQITALTPLSTVTANLGTIADVATVAEQIAGNTSLASIDSKAGNLALEATLQSVRNRLMPSATRTRYLGTSNGANLKNSAGNVYAITISNSNAAIRYFHLFEKATAPTLNDVPVECFPVYLNDGLLIIGQDVIGGEGILLNTGISWGFSSTRLAYTAATATDCICTVRWS